MAGTSRRLPQAKHPHWHDVLDALLALDQMIVEVSMNLYQVGGRDRSRMRSHHRRLHAAMREHLPKLFEGNRSLR